MKDIYYITYDLRENIKFKFFHGPLKFQSKNRRYLLCYMEKNEWIKNKENIFFLFKAK